MATDPGCCAGPNELLRAIFLGINELAGSGGGGLAGAVNLTAINGVAPSVGCGVSTTGTLRVAQATDCVVTTSNNNAAGVAAVNIQDGGNSITVDGTVSIGTSITPGTAATNLGKAEDDPTASGDVGVGMLLKRSDTASSQTSADGDYSLPVVNQFGSVRININRTFQVTDANDILKAEDAVAASGDAGVFALGVANEAQSTLAADGDYIAHATDTKGNHIVVGNLAADAVDAGFPVKVGGQARITNPTPVADADRTNFITDKLGKQVVVGSIRVLKARQVTIITSSTAETTIVTAVAAVFLDLYGLLLSNTSATATEVTVRDATAGGTISSFMVPAGQTVGFMLPESGAWPQGTVNNNWTATCGTSVASLKVTALTVQNL